MSSPEPADAPKITITEAEIDEVIAEFDGDAREAIRALLIDQATLIADAETKVSHGFVRGRFPA